MNVRTRSPFTLSRARRFLEDHGEPEPLIPALIEEGRVFMQGIFGLCALVIGRHLRIESTGAFESGPFAILVAVIGLAFIVPVLPQAVSLIWLWGFRVLHIGQRHRLPGEPWRWDQPWNRTFARSLLVGRAGELCGVLAFLMAGLAPLHLMAFSGGGKPPSLFLALLVFLNVGILLGWGIVLHRLLRVLKFGVSRLSFGEFPFFLGEPLQVTLLDIDRLRQAPEVLVTLRCREQHLVNQDSGKSALAFRTAWKETRRFSPEDLPFGSGGAARLVSLSRRGDEHSNLALRFELPLADLSTRLTEAGNLRYWELLVTARMEGLDYKASFALPVYGRPQENG